MTKHTPAKFNLKDPIHFLALGFGSGLAPKAPGTFGTLVAIPLVLLLSSISSLYLAVIILLMSIAGIYICGKTAKDAGVHDHGAIVWDEIVGLMITMFAMPITWQSILVGFLLFRFFDILKPWPISYLDKNCTGGFGIMIDDVVAGLAAWLVMWFIFV
ncbi:MAG: phosphatidylglycerophosphatase A [Alteromonadaceae bacterium]|nr:phosphatidylglycerophosphatase A [Alteromonadaceae bacterium]